MLQGEWCYLADGLLLSIGRIVLSYRRHSLPIKQELNSLKKLRYDPGPQILVAYRKVCKKKDKSEEV